MFVLDCCQYPLLTPPPRPYRTEALISLAAGHHYPLWLALVWRGLSCPRVNLHPVTIDVSVYAQFRTPLRDHPSWEIPVEMVETFIMTVSCSLQILLLSLPHRYRWSYGHCPPNKLLACKSASESAFLEDIELKQSHFQKFLELTWPCRVHT